MSAIRGRDTKPELTVRRALHSHGLRFRLHSAHLPGRPDIILARHRAVVFVHGCFWHMHSCRYFVWPKSRAEFWRSKILANVSRDKANYRALRRLGWRVFVVWECQLTERRLSRLAEQIDRSHA